MAKKFEIPAIRKVKLEKATAKMSAGLINYLFTEVLRRLAKKNFTSYGAAMHYLEETMTNLPDFKLAQMWASYADAAQAHNLYKELWLLGRDVHSSKVSIDAITEWCYGTTHLHNIGGLLKQPKK